MYHHDHVGLFTQKITHINFSTWVTRSEVLTLTAWIASEYYWQNASSAIASSREHLNGHEHVGRPATHGGLTCWFTEDSWFTGLGARGPRIETRGSHHVIAHPISRQIGFSGSGVRVILQTITRIVCYKTSWVCIVGMFIGSIIILYPVWCTRILYDDAQDSYNQDGLDNL